MDFKDNQFKIKSLRKWLENLKFKMIILST